MTESQKINYNYEHHLDGILQEVISFHHKNGLNKFEQISVFNKQKAQRLSSKYEIKETEKKDLIDMTEYDKKILKEIDVVKEKQLPVISNLTDDILEKANILESAGVTFGKNTWYKIKLAIKRLLIKEDAESLKFWGKIYGKESDYYILYGRLKYYTPAKYPKQPFHEPIGLEGINKYTFWVSNNILEDWYQLPEITNTQMRESFMVNYYFTGNPKAKVKALAPFSGNESHLLKCKILRIMHACFIVPDNYLKTKEVENSEEKFGIDLADRITMYDQEYKPNTSNEEMISLDKWVHEFPYIYPSGQILDLNAENQVKILRGISEDERKFI